MEKKTALYDAHVAAGGKMVPFAGYLMPVQYGGGVIAEHMAVRTAAGLFDVSHMGEVVLRGEDALANLQNLLTNDMASMQVGDCRYSPMCNEKGGVVDDLITYKISEEEYLLVVNAANREKDVRHIRGNLFGAVSADDLSDSMAELALQGPAAEGILAKLVDKALLPDKYYTFKEDINVAGISCLISRTGYTGENGFELYCDADKAPALWDELLKNGQQEGLIPCGLGARDTLRLEAGMPLYGHEMDEDITPRQAGLGMFVKMDKDDFIGKTALLDAGDPDPRRAGLRMTGRGIAREGSLVYKGDEEIGRVTSGTQLPYVGYAGAMALLRADAREMGSKVEVDVRGRRVEAEIVKMPFYKRES